MNFDPLAAIGGNGILRLAELLEAGLVTPPLSALALRDHVDGRHAAPLAECLAQMAGPEAPPTHLAVVLRAFVAGARSAGQASPSIEVVVTGPDVGGEARDTGVVVRQLFAKARERVLVVGFAVHQGKSVFKVLADRLDSDRSLEATLCIDARRQRGDTSIDGDILRRFADEFVRKEWPGDRLPRVYHDPRSLKPTGRTASSMHAKAVVIDGQEALVTSANFTEAAQERNVELGVLIESKAVAERIESHFLTLIQGEHLQRLPLPGSRGSNTLADHS